jgi:hypothetical protein
LRLIEALATDYPTIKALIGDIAFVKWCDAYIKAHPSQHFSLRYFGQHFSTFLQKNNEIMLAELAHFEWLLTCAYDAPDADHLTREALAALPLDNWPTMQLELHPSVYIVKFKTNAPTLWQQFNQDAVMEKLISNNSSTAWVLWRQELKVYFRSLSETECSLLTLLHTTTTWAQLCEAAPTLDAETASQQIVAFLNIWIKDGLLHSLPRC